MESEQVRSEATLLLSVHEGAVDDECGKWEDRVAKILRSCGFRASLPVVSLLALQFQNELTELPLFQLGAILAIVLLFAQCFGGLQIYGRLIPLLLAVVGGVVTTNAIRATPEESIRKMGILSRNQQAVVLVFASLGSLIGSAAGPRSFTSTSNWTIESKLWAVFTCNAFIFSSWIAACMRSGDPYLATSVTVYGCVAFNMAFALVVSIIRISSLRALARKGMARSQMWRARFESSLDWWTS